jgi:transcriptional regulator with XRE-family HTH domain
VPVRESIASLGSARSRQLRQRAADDVRTARLEAGLSRRELSARVGIDRRWLARMERADPAALTIDSIARVAPALGLTAAIGLFPDGSPVRDRAHLDLLRRFVSRIPQGLPVRFEVPVPIAGDRRSGDAVISVANEAILVEAETQLYDIQAIERRAGAKARDLGIERVILLVADTVHNRRVIREVAPLRLAFPVSTRAALARLRSGEPPPANALVVV